MIRWMAAALVLACAGATAQAPKEAQTAQALPPLGTVTGHVIFAETQRPARFASITLVRRPTAKDVKLPDDDDESSQAAKPESKGMATVVSLQGRSMLDGSYVIRNVPVGDYFVFARMVGYVIPIGTIDSTRDDEDLTVDDVDAVMREIPTVHVTADRTASVDLVLLRGGTIGGRLQFEDGSPVTGMYVEVEREKGSSQDILKLRPLYLLQAIGFLRYSDQMDEDGRFHIPSLPPGRYVVKTTLSVEGGARFVVGGSGGYEQGVGGGVRISVYAPGVFRKSEAKVYEIKADERLQADFEVALNDLHTVRGRVFAKSDGHTPNGAQVQLSDKTDDTLSRNANVLPDGSFQIPYVPAGTYTFQALAWDMALPQDVTPNESNRKLKSYATQEMSVIVTDQDVVLADVMLEDAEPKPDGARTPP